MVRLMTDGQVTLAIPGMLSPTPPSGPPTSATRVSLDQRPE
jgi:hypothetical protein